MCGLLEQHDGAAMSFFASAVAVLAPLYCILVIAFSAFSCWTAARDAFAKPRNASAFALFAFAETALARNNDARARATAVPSAFPLSWSTAEIPRATAAFTWASL